MNLDLTHPEIKFAVEAVHQASLLTEKVLALKSRSHLSKSDDSPVTVADFGGQALVADLLLKKFPGDMLVGEESPEYLKSPEGKEICKMTTDIVRSFLPDITAEKLWSLIDLGSGKPQKRFWTLDPVDGTKGFIRGEQYAVALALIEEGQVKLSVLSCPHWIKGNDAKSIRPGSMVVAIKGKGAWFASRAKHTDGFERLKVSGCKDVSQMTLLRSVEASHTNPGRTDLFMKKLEIKKRPILADSQVKYAMVAAGEADAFFYLLPKDNPNYRMKIWDVAPGALVVEEAGGRITDLEGKNLDFSRGVTMANNPGILVTNGPLHEKVLGALKEVQNSL